MRPVLRRYRGSRYTCTLIWELGHCYSLPYKGGELYTASSTLVTEEKR
jgi:hypothetical protein